VLTTIGGVAGIMSERTASAVPPDLPFPLALRWTKRGNLYVADSGNNRITKGTPIYR